MKLVIERAALLKSLAHIQSVVERRNTIPILSNVLVEARDDALKLTATDMDLAIVESVSAAIGSAGATTVPAHTLYEIVRKLPDGAQIELDQTRDANRITLSAGRSRFTLACLPTEDFPMLSSGDLPFAFSIGAGDLRGLIDRTKFAISTEETRYYLNGIYLHATKTNDLDVLRAVATDGHRLARVEMPLPDGAAGMPGVIVPRKTVNELRKLIDDAGNTVRVALSETRIRFTVDALEVTSKLIDGTFPDYQRVIPANNDKTMDVDCVAFAQAVDRVSTISSEKSRGVKLSMANSTLTLSATSPDNGTAVEELEVQFGQKDVLEIGFNSRYLLDIAQQIEGSDARFTMADAASPTIVQDSSDSSALYVLMPMRV
ncbi:MAG TPA: DNA polymerase III subunit beta [Methylomirabilota bacterium]|nr:DNA polymerase III subunit beta [Methylomirabilota bacterium]